jgi:hypothetical protein
MSTEIKPAPVWKRGLAVVLDLLTVFFVGGWLISRITGETTSTGFNLQGPSAMVLIAVIVAYFFCRTALRGRNNLGSNFADWPAAAASVNAGRNPELGVDGLAVRLRNG